MEVNSDTERRKRRMTKKVIDAKSDMCKGGKWTEEEHQRFLEAIELFGNIWKKVETYIGTRSTAQIRSHAQKHFRRLRSQAIAEMKKNNELENNVFVVVREYRNNTYNTSASSGSLFSGASTPIQTLLSSPGILTADELKIKEGQSDCGKEFKLDNSDLSISESIMDQINGPYEKYDIQAENYLKSEENFEYMPEYPAGTNTVNTNSQSSSIDDANFCLFDEKTPIEDPDEEHAFPLLMKVKYDP